MTCVDSIKVTPKHVDICVLRCPALVDDILVFETIELWKYLCFVKHFNFRIVNLAVWTTLNTDTHSNTVGLNESVGGKDSL